jgi:hypothetical protein
VAVSPIALLVPLLPDPDVGFYRLQAAQVGTLLITTEACN